MSDNATSASSNRWGELIELQPQQLIQVALLGAGVGVAVWLLSLIIKQIVLVPLFCGDPAGSMCVGANDTAGTIGLIIGSFIGLLGLVRLSVYRPLLIVIAAAISLWGVTSLVSELTWFEALGWTILLYAVVYALFAWLVRPRAFAVAVVLILVAVVLARLIPSL